MHRTKKMTVITTGVALFMAAGMSSAMAERSNDNEHNDHERVTICHRTGPKDDPRYHEITVSKNALPAHQRHGDIYPVPANGCPKHDDGDDGGDHDGDHNGGNCIADSSSGDTYNEQYGLINVGSPTVHFDNALAGVLCGANTLNNPAVAILGEAYSGGDHSDSDGDCIADSTSGDTYNGQYGAINVGSPTVHLDNALAGVLCGANTANNPAVAIIGDAVGISSLGSGLLSGGPLGILGYGPGFVLSGLQTDVDVLANVLLQF